MGVVDGAENFSDLACSERGDGGGLAFDGPAPLVPGEGVPGDGDGLAGGHAAEFRLVDVDADAEAVEAADAGNLVADIDVGSRADGEVVDNAADRSADEGLLDLGASQLLAGFRVAQPG